LQLGPKTEFKRMDDVINTFRDYIKSDNIELEISILREWYAQYANLTHKDVKNYHLMRQSGCTTALVRVCGFLTYHGYSVAMVVRRQDDVRYIKPIIAHHKQPMFPIFGIQSFRGLRGYNLDLVVTDNLDYCSPRDVAEFMECVFPVARVLLRFNTI
jgi:hypothetical protein